MSNDDYYRKQASDAQAQADRAFSPNDKAAWLRIGQSWLALISKPIKGALEKFDDEVKERGTGQKNSTTSN